VWEFFNGEIPENHHIHHKDKDKSNNSIDNLELLSASEHSKHHAKENEWVGSESNKNQLREAGKKSAEWHASKAGIEWHSKHGKKSWENRELATKNCIVCNTEFKTPFPTRAKFCCRRCKYQASKDKSTSL
jgi:hypothetical protein